MKFFGSEIVRRSFFEDVQVIADFLNLTTLEYRRCTIFSKIARIGVFLLVTVVSFFFASLVSTKNIMDTAGSTNSVDILSLSIFGTWLINNYILIAFTCSTTDLRRVVRIVTKVDLFLWQTIDCKKRVSYFRTAMAVKYLVLLVMGFLLIPRFLERNKISLLWTILAAASILFMFFLGDMCIRKFTVMVHFIERRFKVLEDLLKETWILQNKGWQQDVKTLIQAQDLLCDACAVLNSAWRWMLVALVGTTFVNLVRSSVTLSVSIKATGIDLLLAYELSYLLVYWLWNLYDITHYTQQCESQVQEFNSTLYCLALSSTQIMRNAEQDFVDTLWVQLGRKRKVVFTAHGLLPINNTLVHSVLASVFTTVIIILQTGA